MDPAVPSKLKLLRSKYPRPTTSQGSRSVENINQKEEVIDLSPVKERAARRSSDENEFQSAVKYNENLPKTLVNSASFDGQSKHKKNDERTLDSFENNRLASKIPRAPSLLISAKPSPLILHGQNLPSGHELAGIAVKPSRGSSSLSIPDISSHQVSPQSSPRGKEVSTTTIKARSSSGNVTNLPPARPGHKSYSTVNSTPSPNLRTSHEKVVQPLRSLKSSASNNSGIETWFRSRRRKDFLSSHSGWFSGPNDQAGRLFDSSDRNILCMSLRENECVIGSADHGLKVFNVTNGKMTRELFSKKYGHHEWVTCVDYLPNGQIISGGMDSKLCLWHPKLVQCQDLLGHTASISCVAAGDSGRLAVSGSYDKSLIVWDLPKAKMMAEMKGHKDPIMDLRWDQNFMLSGDRGGISRIWDTETGSCNYILKGHKKQISAMDLLVEQNLAVTGSLDGQLKIWDLRNGEDIFSSILHPGGAVNCLDHSITGSIVSAGADKRIQVMDLRRSNEPLRIMTDHKDFIYSLKVFNRLSVSGGGNGWCLVHDIETGQCLYGLGANQHAVRCIEATEHFLVTAGDDGNAVVFDFK